ncbi:MAG: pyridoxal-phosphate-dependent aminotransferase family protein [Nitrososphaerales archaeon]
MIPGPTNVPHRVMQAMTVPIINHRSDDFRKMYRGIQEKTKKVFQTDKSEIVVLTTSGTGGVEAAVVNLVRKGDKVVIPVNGEFSSRLATMIELAGGEAIRVNSPYGETATYDQVKEAFDNNKGVKALYVVYNETSTGTRVTWLDRAKDLTSRDDAFFIADAVSNFGGDELPVDKWGVDIGVTASQKCLAAPPGLAPISVSSRAAKFMKDNPPPTLYLNLPRYFKYFDQSAETPFTPALPLYFAFDEALDMILEEGMDARIKRHKKCADAFYSALNSIGFSPFAKPDVRSNTVIALNYRNGMEDKKFRGLLAKEFKVLVAGGFGELKGKVWRIGSMGEVSRYHVMRTLSAISSALNIMGMKTNADALSVAEEKLGQQ